MNKAGFTIHTLVPGIFLADKLEIYRCIILLKNPISDFMKLVFAVWSFGVV